MPRYVLFAGVNGTGKSTFYQTNYVNNIPEERVNVDEILRSRLWDWNDKIAQMKAIQRRKSRYR